MTYLRARYYDPSIGRFISEDPVKDGLNWYVYCANDPVNMWDPMGYKAKGELISISNGNYEDIKAIQKHLNDLGYVGKNGALLSIDGDFGTNTKFAVESYQQEFGLAVDGIVGDNTWEALGFEFSKTNHGQRNHAFDGMSDEEVSSKARDKSLPANERRKYQTEEKFRDLRNKQKRENKYKKIEVYRDDGAQVDPNTLMPTNPIPGGAIIFPKEEQYNDSYIPNGLYFVPLPATMPIPVTVPMPMLAPI